MTDLPGDGREDCVIGIEGFSPREDQFILAVGNFEQILIKTCLY